MRCRRLRLRAVAAGMALTALLWPERVLAVPPSAVQLVFMPDLAHDSVRVVESLQGPPSDAGVWKIPLPQGYVNLEVDAKSYQVEDGMLRIQHGDGSAIVFSFELPFRGLMGVQWTYTAPQTLDEAELWVPEDGSLAVSADDLLTTTRQVAMGDMHFRVLTRLGLAAGVPWTISVQRLPPAAAAPPGANIPTLGTALGPVHQMVQAAANLGLVAVVLSVTVWGLRSDRRLRRSRTPMQEEREDARRRTRQQGI